MTRTVAEAESIASKGNGQKSQRFGESVENRCQIYLSRYFSNDIPLLRSNTAHFRSEDNSAEAQHADRVPLSNETSDPKRSLVKCLSLPDHRTFIEDYLKILDFIEWLKEYYPDKVPQLSHRK